MIIPGNQVPPDDTFDDDAEDQQSQQDIHSNGFEDELGPDDLEEPADIDSLQRAYEASESAFTLDFDDDDEDLDED